MLLPSKAAGAETFHEKITGRAKSGPLHAPLEGFPRPCVRHEDVPHCKSNPTRARAQMGLCTGASRENMRMKKLLLLSALLGFVVALPSLVFAGQEDCKEGETWSETTQQCEKSDG